MANKKENQSEQPTPKEKSAPIKPSVQAVSDNGEISYLTEDSYDDEEWIGKIYADPRQLDLSVKAMCFHNLDGKGKPVGVNDDRIYKYLIHTQHVFVCGGIPYIYMGGYYHMDLRGTIIKTLIKACMLESFVKSSTVDRVFKLFLQDYEIEKLPDELNAHAGKYINFENGMYDVEKRKVYNHSPKILSVNQIPWKYDPSEDHGTGIEIEKFLKHAIPDKDDREMLLEYIGLCCSIDTTQQKMMVICGDGGTGKSTIINLIQKIVGKRNTSNVAMSKLEDNFQAIRMMGKLLNSCADLEIDALDDVTMIKKLIGEDSISDSYKGKDIISFDNYAKLLFSTNELPLVRNEKTEGFYRRLLILTMNEQPKRRDPKLHLKLEKEIPFLLHLAMEALHRMHERGYILESEKSKEKVRQLRNDSDTIEAFLNECCKVTRNPEDKASRKILFEKYAEYCKEYERTAHTRNNFYKALRNKGFFETKVTGEWFFSGLTASDDAMDPDGFIDIDKAMAKSGGVPDIPFDG